eukprot:747782-Hanusia_phi.AAC.2
MMSSLTSFSERWRVSTWGMIRRRREEEEGEEEERIAEGERGGEREGEGGKEGLRGGLSSARARGRIGKCSPPPSPH